eukprot:5480746-Ditylum_brightwellii.AAC.2
MNLTKIKQIEATVAFFVFSHIKYHSRKGAAVEIAACTSVDGFDLHVHTCCHMQQCHTKTIAITCRRQSLQDVRGKLYKNNNQISAVKARYPHTQNWIFVPFKADGFITDYHIALMIRKQNIYLQDKTAILLSLLKTANGSNILFSTVKKDPNEVYYFVTKKKLRDEAEEWIDQLPDFPFSQFLPENTRTVTTDSNPTCNYKSLPTEHMDDAVTYYNSVLSDQLPEIEACNEQETIDVVEEDFLENCWSSPPHLVYSKLDKSTMDSTVSSITNNNTSPRKFKTQKDETWEVLAKRIDALKRC